MARISGENVAQTRTVYVKITDRRARKEGDTRVVSARSNGAVKTWKTRPEDFRAPFKYGLRDCFYITPDNARFFFTTEAEAREEGEVYN
jgi:hypothetical protein